MRAKEFIRESHLTDPVSQPNPVSKMKKAKIIPKPKAELVKKNK